MNWIAILAVVAFLIGVLLLKRAGQIPADLAKRYLKDGALLIDVRTATEYAAGHLRNAINIPLDQIESVIARKATDRSQALLLHCQSGMRSAVAKKRLQAMGYTRAFNLGSYQRAAQIVSGS